MKQNHKHYDVIIVGGGHNGLVAASYLARAGKAVLLLEAHDELGGATTSVKPFPEYDARLSRYAYLVSLLPDQIVADLGLNFKTLGRTVSSSTPYQRDGREDGLLVSAEWDERTESSFRRLAGSDQESKAWREFYGQIAELESGPPGVRIETESGQAYTARDLLFAAAPQHLARLRGCAIPDSLEGSQLKINMLLSRLPRLKSGLDPRIAFAGTLHVNESFSQLEAAYTRARAGEMPQPLPLDLYCHTLTDPTILSPELNEKGFQTLTLFGFPTAAQLFDADPERAKALAKERALASLNQYLLDPIESVLAPCRDGALAIEAKSPLDLEKDIALPRGNIFHRDLDFPFLDGDAGGAERQRWGAETDDPHIYLAGAGARRGGGVSGIAGHNAAMALLTRQ